MVRRWCATTFDGGIFDFYLKVAILCSILAWEGSWDILSRRRRSTMTMRR